MDWKRIDGAIVFGVLSQAWGLIGGPVTVILIANRFSPELQGLHYTFFSMLGAQALIELGMSQVIIQFISHEWSRLQLSYLGEVEGEPEARSRLTSVFRMSLRWYAYGAGLFGVAMSVGGTYFFSSVPIHLSWFAPWIALCAAYSLILALMPFWAVLEGTGQVQKAYGYRLVQGIVGSLTIWASITLGAGVWAAFIASACSLMAGAFLLLRYHWRFFLSLMKTAPGPTIDWKSAVWPLQWRVAITYIVGYVTYMAFTPIMFIFHGPIVAGRMGMSWALISSLASVSIMFVVTKVPQFGVLIAREKFRELDILFARCCAACFGVALLGSLAILTLIAVLQVHQPIVSARLLSLQEIAVFLAATLLFQVAVAEALYLRAHKREPLIKLTVATGILSVGLTFMLGRYYGPMGIAVGYLAVALTTLPISTIVLIRCRRRWHFPADAGRAIPSLCATA